MGCPAAALVFLPLLLQVHYARAPLRLVSRAASRLPLSGFGPLDSFITAATSDPDEIAAVLHGVLVGPIAPTSDQRRAITAPALVLGHGIDLIHSFSDAKRLARQLPDARLIRTRTFAELWVWPGPPDRRDQRVPRPRLGGHRAAGAARRSLVRSDVQLTHHCGAAVTAVVSGSDSRRGARAWCVPSTRS